MNCECGETKIHAKGKCSRCYKREHFQRVSKPKRDNPEYREKARDYAKAYWHSEVGQDKYIKGLESGRILGNIKKYQSTEKGKNTLKKAHDKYGESHPERRKAHWKVGYAVRSGKLKKPCLCDECRKEGRIHAHHEDYTKPLDVIWLCQECHIKTHENK